MKDFIRKWLDLPTREEINDRIDRQVLSKVDKRYNKLKKADKDRYKKFTEAKNESIKT